jgi:hypothetical protein
LAGDGVVLGEGEGHALGLALTEGVGTATGRGPTLAKYNANGTTIMPATTVSTNVTAPHSRLKNAQLTSREL